MMRRRKLILVGAVALVAATTAHAGPLQRLFGRCGQTRAVRCQSAQTMPVAVRTFVQPAPVRSAVGNTLVHAGGLLAGAGETIRSTSFDGLTVPTDPTVYTPIRLSAPLPTCAGGVCGK